MKGSGSRSKTWNGFLINSTGYPDRKIFRGTGLGLAISRGIIEAHGGTIRAENRPGGGTIMTIQMPRDGVK